jgi:adenylate cyclase class 2
MEKLETEVKFYLEDIASMRNRMRELGIETKRRVFETNIRYEDRDNTMIQKKSVLRLRQDEKTTLTFKSRPGSNSRDFKVLRELEVEVDDMATMSQILEGLFIDTMPYGNFLEIEGLPQDIKTCASRLGLGWHKRILLNYLEIFEIIRKRLNLKIKDLTFKNFENVRVDMAAFLDQLEAGRR